MQIVPALSWQQVGAQLLASVDCNFAIDLEWQIAISGSIGSDYFEARSVDVNGYQLAAGIFVTLDFNSVPVVIPAGTIQTYSLAPHQRYMRVTSTGGAPSRMRLTFYPIARPEWR